MRQLKLAVIGGGALVILGLLALTELGSSHAPDATHQTGTAIAARHHLRSRSSNFYARAKPQGGPAANRSSR